MQAEPARNPTGATVQHRRGGPVMTVEFPVGHLLLCSWIDQFGRVRRQTVSPNELVFTDPGHLTWLRALARVASRYRLAAVC